MVPVEQITKQRLERWSAHFLKAHATPLLLIGMGHDHNIGQVVICTLEAEDLDKEQLRKLLLFALDNLPE